MARWPAHTQVWVSWHIIGAGFAFDVFPAKPVRTWRLMTLRDAEELMAYRMQYEQMQHEEYVPHNGVVNSYGDHHGTD